MSGVHDIKLRAYLRWVATGRIQAEAAAKRRTAGPRKRKGEGNYLSASISAEIQGQSLLGLCNNVLRRGLWQVPPLWCPLRGRCAAAAQMMGAVGVHCWDAGSSEACNGSVYRLEVISAWSGNNYKIIRGNIIRLTRSWTV